MITGWAGGACANAIEALPRAQRSLAARDSLAGALGVTRRWIDRHERASWAHDWTSDPFTGGAYSFPRVHGSRAARALAQPLEHTLFFAGEATAPPPHNGTVHGAFDSGRRAAREILGRGRH